MDTFQLNILLGTKPSRTFELNDEIDIYIGDGASDPTDLVINGIITEISYRLSVDGNLVINEWGVLRNPVFFASSFSR